MMPKLDLLQLDNAERSAETSSFAANSLREELNAERVRMNNLRSHLATAQREVVSCLTLQFC